MNKRLSRRTVLRGLGAAVSLPLLDAMVPAFASPVAPQRLAFIYVPNGILMNQWTPTSVGADFELTRILTPLAPHRDNLLVLSGLTQNTGRALGDAAGDHARASATYLTGVHPRKTDGAGICAGISVDQVAASHVGAATKLPSLELGCEDGRLVGNCDSGYSCAYNNTLSWRTPSAPLPPEINPRAVFERLFGALDENPADRRKLYELWAPISSSWNCPSPASHSERVGCGRKSPSEFLPCRAAAPTALSAPVLWSGWRGQARCPSSPWSPESAPAH